jgi:shikimate dehydrogenase
VIGDPVRHSLSPVIHNAAFEATELDWTYVAFPVPTGHGAAAVDAMRTLGISGLSVTMPHKAAAATAVDRLSPTAARLGVVNTLYWQGSELVGESTDGAGFVDALRAEQEWDPAGTRCVVLGSGGAARAVTLALADAGAATVTVVGRNTEAAGSCASLAGPAGVVGPVDAIDDAALVVNATPVGMGDAASSSGPAAGESELVATYPFGVRAHSFGTGQLVVDLVYVPLVTPLMEMAAARGAAMMNGLPMLVHQAGHQFRLWTGQDAPLAMMADAATRSVAPTGADCLVSEAHGAGPTCR